jgi:hypothetical protein
MKSKIDEYTFKAIQLEGSNNWPMYWKPEIDPIYKKYLSNKEKKKDVDVKKYIEEAKKYFSKKRNITYKKKSKSKKKKEH